jgi:hypothetical protein
MSSTATHQSGSPGAMPSPSAIISRVQPRRRRPGLIAFGVLAVVLGALGASFLVLSIGSTSQYLAVARPVDVGAKITDADLQVVDVNAALGLKPIPAQDRSRVVGRYARVELVPGTLLAPDHLTDVAGPASGQQLIGIGLKPANLPARTLHPGDAVMLVVLPDPRTVGGTEPSAKPGQSSGQSPVLSTPPTVRATVFGVGKPQPDGQVVVDVIVSSSEGPGLVSLASQGRVGLIVTPKA